jgi:hypothetical protein
VAALIADHPDDLLSIELNGVVRASGTQVIDFPTTATRDLGLWSLDRIDQVSARHDL